MVRNRFVSHKDVSLVLIADVRTPLIGDIVSGVALASIPSCTSNKNVSKNIVPQRLGNQVSVSKFKYYLDYQF